MTPEFENQDLPAWCENCNKQGYYFPDDMYKTYHVIHKKCGYEIISANCPDCTMGFAIPNPPGEKPKTWTCDGCGKAYELPSSVFENPLNLYIKDELPKEIFDRIEASYSNGAQYIGVIVVVGLLIYYLLTR